MSSKLAELAEELTKATSDLEQEKATTLAQIEEIDALKKVCNIIDTETCRTDFFIEWVIPENIHTIPRVASWNSMGEGGFLDWNSEGMGGGGGVMQFGIPKAWRGGGVQP